MKIKNSLVKKFISYSLLFSTLIIFPLIIGNLYFEYKNEVKRLQSSLDQFEKKDLNSLATSVWYVDRVQIDKQLEGLVRAEPFYSVTLDASILSKQEYRSNTQEKIFSGPLKSFNLIYDGNNLGTVTVRTSLNHVLDNLLSKFYLVLFSVILNTAVVVSLILLLFRRIITNPLLNTTEYLNSIRFDQTILSEGYSNLKLSQEDQEKYNELELVNESILKLHDNFKNSYDNLLKAKERLTDIIDFSSSAVFETNESFNFVHISFAKREDSKILLDLIKLNTNLLDLPFEDQTKNDIKNYEHLFETQLNIEEEYYHIVLKLLRDKDQKLVGHRGVIFNVSNIVNTEKKLREQNNQIFQMQKISAIGELTASIVHDFKNFLTVINYANEWILKKSQTDQILISNERLLFHINNSKQAAHKADNLISNLLDFSRRHISKPEEINIYNFVNSMAEILHVAITKKYGLEIILVSKIENCFVDPNVFESALLNLCVNAKDALGAKGKVTIEFSEKELNSHPQLPDGKYVLMKFCDNGKGMPICVQQRIFEPFYTTKPIGKGTGLGLSMIANFMHSSHGLIEVQSTEGLGTCFYLYFPTQTNLKL